MALILPQSTDSLLSKAHSFLHRVFAADSSAPEQSLVVNSSGYVGIGTTSPGYKLDVQSGASAIRIKSTTATHYANLFINNGGGDFYFGRDSSVGGQLATGSTGYAGVINAQGTYPLQFAVNNTIGITMLNGGSVGIGTSSPSGKLQISKTTADSTPVINVQHGSSLTSASYQNAGLWVGEGTSSGDMGLALWTDGTNNKAYIETVSWGTSYDKDLIINANGGNVGIGVITPASKLHVLGNIRSDASTAGIGFQLYSEAGTQLGYFGRKSVGGLSVSALVGTNSRPVCILNDNANTNILQWTDSSYNVLGVIDKAGNFGLGITSPSGPLDVVGAIFSRYKSGQTWPVDANGYVATYVYDNDGTKVGRILPYNGSSYLALALGNWNSGNPNIMLAADGKVGIGVGVPTAKLHLAASTATAGTASLKISAGTPLTTPEAGVVEFDGTDWYFTV